MTASRRAAGVAALAAVALLAFGPRRAWASTFERVPDLEPCQEAALFAADDAGDDAERARRRCRLAEFTRQQNEQRMQRQEEAERRREQRVKAALANSESPREWQRFGADLFLAGGMATVGLAVIYTPFPDLELEVWLGDKGTESHYKYDRSVTADGSAAGARAKWITGSGQLSPFFSGGFTGARADLQTYSFNGMTSNSVNGSGWAHALTAGIGAALATKLGFRMSLEYLFSYVTYAQAALDVPGRPHDRELRAAWSDVLDESTHAVRFQVGYAF